MSDNTKPSNPKDYFGMRKVPILSVLPLRVLSGIALGMLEGALKYSRHNYRVVGVRASVYVDAAARHLMQYMEGQDIDSESKANLHHIDKAITSLVVLRDSIYQGNCVDDRPPRAGPGWMDDANIVAHAMVNGAVDPKPPCTEVDFMGAVTRLTASVAPSAPKKDALSPVIDDASRRRIVGS